MAIIAGKVILEIILEAFAATMLIEIVSEIILEAFVEMPLENSFGPHSHKRSPVPGPGPQALGPGPGPGPRAPARTLPFRLKQCMDQAILAQAFSRF